MANKNPNSKKICDISSAYNETIQGYREFMEHRQDLVKYDQTMLMSLYERGLLYLSSCDENHPATIGQLTLAMGVSKTDLSRMRNGHYDYQLPMYLDVNGITYEDIEREDDKYFFGVNALQYTIDANGNKVLLMAYSDIVKLLCAVVEAKTEELLLKGKNTIPAIFYLKAVFNYRDNTDTEHIDKPLIGADAGQVRKALKMLDLE